jgi:RND family efflux transporter MFP subunit
VPRLALSLPSAFLSAFLLAALACGGGNEYVEPPPPVVEVSLPAQQGVIDYLEVTGTTEAINVVEVRARVTGYLQSVDFEEGDDVEEGDLLFVIDPAEFQAEVDRRQATAARQRAALRLAQARLQRLEQALETRAVSEIEVIEARAARDEVSAQLAAAQANLEKAKLDLAYTRIHAPLEGRVGRSLVDPGNLVGAGESTLLTTLVQYDPMYADFDVSERDVLALADETAGEGVGSEDERLAELRRIPLQLGRANDEGFPIEGKLFYSDLAIDPDTGTFLLRGIFPNPEPRKLLPGLFVRVRMPIGEREGALLVPDQAIGADQGGSYLLIVAEGDVVEQRRVELGARVEGKRVVESGLEAGDRVIVNGLLRARPGAKVSPRQAGAGAPVAEAAAGSEG